MTIDVAHDGRVATVTLNRPEQRNAVSHEMRGDLAREFEQLDRDPEIRVVVLTGAGSAFCAGVDLKETGGVASEPVVRPLELLTKPLIAAVNGPAIGAGLELALASDIRLAAESARFGLPEVRIGSLAGSGGIQRLSRAVAPSLAATMIFTGEPIDSTAALRAGLVSEVVPDGELQARAAELGARISANAPLSLSAAKRALRTATEPPADAITLERELWTLLSTTADREEGRAAFREQRPPHFKGA